MGTTGWYDHMDKAKKIVAERDIGFIWSANFSIGVNIFFKIIKEAGKVFNRFPDYDVMCYELHHNRKADSPSGTAEMIGNIIVEKLDRKQTLVKETLCRRILPTELHVASVRGGETPGTHVVTFDSPFDTIELKHTVRSREGLALGALRAAEFIKDRKGFFDIEDLMGEIISNTN
jgi:4-hydroxy-tetrahydrodipicolinate reductase